MCEYQGQIQNETKYISKYEKNPRKNMFKRSNLFSVIISPLILMIEEIVFVAEIFREEQIILKFLYDAGKIILQSLYILNHMFLSGT